MIEDYRGLAIFVAVANAGSFSQAGRQLKLSPAAVSHHITKLESKLGVSLFFRSTRALSLTQEGKNIIGPARRMVSAAEEAIDTASDVSDQPMGRLRITLPAFGVQSPIHKAVLGFCREFPLVTLAMHSTDKQVDIIKEGYDLAIRLGQLKDSALKSRKIANFERILVAAPSYLDARAPIETIDDLPDCDFVSMAILPTEIKMEKGGEEVTIEPFKFKLEVNSVNDAKAAILSGFGIQRMPLTEVVNELENGSLVQVLPDWSLASQGIYVVWPDLGPQKSLTRRLIDYLIENQSKKTKRRA